MSKAHITDFVRNNPQGLVIENFMDAAEEYLGLHHGDTSSHPYVPVELHTKNLVADVKAVFTAVGHAVKNSVSVQPTLNWHAEYCLRKFGKTTPGFDPA